MSNISEIILRIGDNKKLYLSIKEACEMLQVSRPTFNKIRKQNKLIELAGGGTHRRFLRTEIETLSATTRKTFTTPLTKDESKKILTIFSKDTIAGIQTAETTFDLRRIGLFDPSGVLDLFCTILQLANSGKKVHLEIEDNFICNNLKSLGFFAELERMHQKNIICDTSVLKTNYEDYLYPIGLTALTMRKQEVPVVEKIIKLLRSQGFSEAIGGYIGWIIGELVDNSMTHLVYNNYSSDCYLLAQRYKFKNSSSECLIISVADVGPGIHATLKKNPKYEHLTNTQALLTAFKPKVSSWPDEYNRGKGLTDIFGIAMGNQSVLKVESGSMKLQIDFRTNNIYLESSLTEAHGTRFTLVLIDRDFEMKSKAQVTEFIDQQLEAL